MSTDRRGDVRRWRRPQAGDLEVASSSFQWLPSLFLQPAPSRRLGHLMEHAQLSASSTHEAPSVPGSYRPGSGGKLGGAGGWPGPPSCSPSGSSVTGQVSVCHLHSTTTAAVWAEGVSTAPRKGGDVLSQHCVGDADLAVSPGKDLRRSRLLWGLLQGSGFKPGKRLPR